MLRSLGEGIAVAGDNLRANKLRSFLTILGVVIGVATVMVMASLVDGVRTQVFNALNAATPNAPIVTAIGIHIWSSAKAAGATRWATWCATTMRQARARTKSAPARRVSVIGSSIAQHDAPASLAPSFPFIARLSENCHGTVIDLRPIVRSPACSAST